MVCCVGDLLWVATTGFSGGIPVDRQKLGQVLEETRKEGGNDESDESF